MKRNIMQPAKKKAIRNQNKYNRLKSIENNMLSSINRVTPQRFSILNAFGFREIIIPYAK